MTHRGANTECWVHPGTWHPLSQSCPKCEEQDNDAEAQYEAMHAEAIRHIERMAKLTDSLYSECALSVAKGLLEDAGFDGYTGSHKPSDLPSRQFAPQASEDTLGMGEAA